MRISSSAIFDVNVTLLNQQEGTLLHTQQQVATGRRMLTPADDPVASSLALNVSQSDAANTQYSSNRIAATSSLSMAESNLQSVTTLLQRVKTTAVEGGDGALSMSDKQVLAMQLTADLAELQALANSTDGSGNYLFSGAQGRTQPFFTTAAGVQYMADDSQRLMQVSTSRQIPTSQSGADIFMRIKDGNGTFSVQPDPAANAGIGNTGTGISSQGIVTNPATVTAAGVIPAGGSYSVLFAIDPVTKATTYSITSTVPPAAPVVLVPPIPGIPYVSGQAIVAIPGVQFDVSGVPANGDAFTIAPSKNESIFKTISDLIATMGQTGATATNSLNRALHNLDSDLNNVLIVRSSMGSRLNELTSLQTTGDNLGVTYKTTLSDLQDLNYNQGVSDLNRQQLGLQAAQKSFTQISSLSLFTYL